MSLLSAATMNSPASPTAKSATGVVKGQNRYARRRPTVFQARERCGGENGVEQHQTLGAVRPGVDQRLVMRHGDASLSRPDCTRGDVRIQSISAPANRPRTIPR